MVDSVVESDSARYVVVLKTDTELAKGSVAALVRHADRNPELGRSAR